jgi:HD-like signal output (HDOD) protein
MRGGYQPVRFPGNLDEGEDVVLQELERLEFSPARLPLSTTHRRKLCGLLHAPILELDRMVHCVERDPLLAVSVLRLVTDELAGIDPIRISDCIVIAGRDRLLALAESENAALTRVPALDEFAERSQTFSLIASRLAASTRVVDVAAARLAALLHALGELPILLSGRGAERYSPATIAAWGERLASSWRLPSALVSAIAAYGPRICDGAPDPMQLIIGAARHLVDCELSEESPLAAALLDCGESASVAAKCQWLS